jgi:hypothetical protein
MAESFRNAFPPISKSILGDREKAFEQMFRIGFGDRS